MDNAKGFDRRGRVQGQPDIPPPRVEGSPYPARPTCEAGRIPGTSRESNLGRHDHRTQFCIGQAVNIDGDVLGRVISIVVNPAAHLYRVAYWSNGNMCESTIEEFRVTAA